MQEAIDLTRARRDTPGCAHVLHFNNAGSSLPPRPVLDAVVRHLELEAEIGGYEAADRERAAIEHVYDATAALLNCRPDEVAIVENATRAWDMAFYSLPFSRGDRILTVRAEYASNYIAFLQVARRTGAVIEVIDSDETGQVSVDALRRAIDDRVKLIAITHVPTNGGLVNPAAAVGRVAREAGIPYLLDACQSVGQMPIDVEAIGCDMLSATGRKYLRGPRGTGFLYVRRSLLGKLEPAFLDLHAAKWVAHDRYEIRDDARRFENWETYVAGKIGLGVAIDYAMGWGLEPIRDRVRALADLLRGRLAAMPGVTVQDLGVERCGIVTFTVEGIEPLDIKKALAAESINVSASALPSTRLDMEARGLARVVRASVHYYNSEDEVERFSDTLRRITP
ncbi:MAG TPA: aminotransferase class V-fold PLP-dependent enzyme [Candidatus Limnocylindrales bacterium]|nr:aminotransferase class V-fold PLP-dependent enzyme [Candidatus Limnocylindrales bacterium]